MKTDLSISKKDLERIENFRLIDDDFMTKVFDGRLEETELVLKIILGIPDLSVLSVVAQKEIKNLQGRSARFDIHAVDSKKKLYDIEIQRADKGAGAKRARYNSSIIDANTILAGEQHEQLPETYVIFITENDVLAHDLRVYHIERIVQETGELFDDKAHTVYVNAAYSNEENEIGRLMHDFRETDPKKMHNAILADRVGYFKNDPEGRSIMCKAMEDMRNDAVLEEQKNRIAMKLRKGKDPKEIHEDDEYPMELILSVQKELLAEVQ